MNREQAENILEAYINIECDGGDNKARQSLREVILDAMTEYRSKPTTWPGITIPTTNYPTNWCGEDIETNGCERVVCPRCGRVITE